MNKKSDPSNAGHVVHIAPRLPFDPPTFPPEDLLEVNVLYTDAPGTRIALNRVTTLSQGMETRIRLIALQVVPYQLPLIELSRSSVFAEGQIRSLVSNLSMDARVDIYLCRQWMKDLLRILKPHSLVVLGTHGLWWRFKEWQLARLLRKNGHQVVIFASNG